MCSGIEARHEDRVYRVIFESVNAAFPVQFADTGEIQLIKWGRRKKELGTGPQGGWARQSTIDSGGWAYMQPRRGYGLIERFMVGRASPGLHGRRLSQWIEVPAGEALDCLIVGEGDLQRAYVVTTSPPAKYRAINDKWPVLTRIELSPIGDQQVALRDLEGVSSSSS